MKKTIEGYIVIFCLCFMSSMTLSSCGEKPKESFENDTYVDIMGTLSDTAIGNSGFRIKLPSLYKIDAENYADYSLYSIHPIDTANNKSSIRLYIGANPDTIAPFGSYTRIPSTGTKFGKPANLIIYESGESKVSRTYIDDWQGKKLMLELVTNNMVESFNMQRVMESFVRDTLVNY